MRVIALLVALIATPAPASSPDAWEEFREAVARACTALVTTDGEVTVEVNPFGSESYGAAIVTLTAGRGEDRMICIFDKVRQTAELTAPFQE